MEGPRREIRSRRDEEINEKIQGGKRREEEGRTGKIGRSSRREEEVSKRMLYK